MSTPMRLAGGMDVWYHGQKYRVHYVLANGEEALVTKHDRPCDLKERVPIAMLSPTDTDAPFTWVLDP